MRARERERVRVKERDPPRRQTDTTEFYIQTYIHTDTFPPPAREAEFTVVTFPLLSNGRPIYPCTHTHTETHIPMHTHTH